MQGYIGQDKCQKWDSIRIMPEYRHMLDSEKDELFAAPPQYSCSTPPTKKVQLEAMWDLHKFFGCINDTKQATNDAKYCYQYSDSNVIPFELFPFEQYVENTGKHKTKACTSETTHQTHD